jgi:hypothetical protein
VAFKKTYKYKQKIMEQSKAETNKTVSTYLPKEERGMSFPINSTALLVIDPVNDFLSEGGEVRSKNITALMRQKDNIILLWL